LRDGLYLTSLGNEGNPKPKPSHLKPLIHPTTFPNVATLSVLVQNDDITWEVQDNFQKQTYRNRYHICTDQGLHKLSIPIKHVGGKDGRQKYADVQIDNSYHWQVQHWRTLQTAYRTSPFFEYYEDELAPLFHKRFQYLLEFNWATISFLCTAISLDFNTVRTTDYQKNPRNVRDLRHLVNAKKGLKGSFEPYPQVFGERHGFIPNTSALDVLFNEGPGTMVYLKKLVIE